MPHSLIKKTMTGIVIAFCFFESTLTNDTTFYNVLLFTAFYIGLSYVAVLVDIPETVVLGAFLTKMVFTTIDQRLIKNKNPIS